MIQKRATDVAFGAPPAEQALPPAFVPVAQPAPAPAGPRVSRVTPSVGRPSGVSERPETDPCPEAKINAFPLEEATFESQRPPADGAYRWRRAGTQTVDGVTVPVSGFETRFVTGARRLSDSTFTFKTSQVGLDGRTAVTTWTVNSEPVSAAAQGGSAGEPERGLTLNRIETFGRDGKQQAAFAPTPGILFLPLSVDPDERWTSVGGDPLTGQVLEHVAQVEGRVRVDACGELVDGWQVTATQRLNGGQAVRTYRYVVATQYGGIIVGEQVDGSSGGGAIKVTFNIAEVPAPAREPR